MAQELILTPEMMAVLGVLALTIILFITEVVRVDVAAVLIMVLLGVTGMVSGDVLFNGFASNAVISIIAVMIIGAGLDKTGVMSTVASLILKFGGRTEKRIIPMISSTVGVISSFMQNVGAAALFLPVVARISARTNLPMSRLLMPMGFCAILGGTITMVGSSPLILLNDLILTSNTALEAQGRAPMTTFELFDVTPLGLAMVATGILYFVIAGRFVLPANTTEEADSKGDTMAYLKKVYGIEGDCFELVVSPGSALVGKTVEQLDGVLGGLFLLAIRDGDNIRLAPTRETKIDAGAILGVLGTSEQVEAFASAQRAEIAPELVHFGEMLSPTKAGIIEIVVPPSSSLIGKRMGDVRMRKSYGATVLAVYRQDQVLREDVTDLVFQSGDTLAIHSAWDDVAALDKGSDFVVASDYPHEEMRPHKVGFAVLFFLIALSLIIFTDLKLSVCVLTGALGMILTGVLTIDEAYEAVSWKTVFLLASLIPLGLAVETSGTAAWIAQETLSMMEGVPIWGLQLAIAVLATFFTLVMSNVGATVLLVPLAVNIAIGAGADPRIFALTVAIATSNSFLIPTHQVNALIMGPAGYRVKDFMRAGGVMTILFLVVMMVMLNVMF